MADLARRCLLPEDAAEADAIVTAVTRHSHAAVYREHGELVGVALGSASHKDSTIAHLDLLLVDPAHRRQGIARRLLEEVEEKLRGLGFTSIKAAGNPPDYAWPGVDVRYTAAVCALTSAGYTHTRTAWNMTAPLPPRWQALERPLPADVEVRRAGKDDLELLLPVVNAQWGPAWTAEVERAVTTAGGVHIALRDNAPVAFAAWGGCRPSWFGPMGTLPAAAGLGLGGLLLRRCLDDQAALGLTRAQIGWVGPVPFYANAVDALIERVFFLFDKRL